MDTIRKRGVLTGILFLTAMVSSLAGGGLIESVLSRTDYLNNIASNTALIHSGIILELINAAAVIGIAVTVFPVIKKYGESLALGYTGFRIIESFLCILSAFIPLLLLTIGSEYEGGPFTGSQFLPAFGSILKSARMNLAEIFIPVFFSLGAFLFYYSLFILKFIPRYISVWGFIGAVLILAKIFIDSGTVLTMILVLPIITNEIFLGIWLIVKGFNTTTIPGTLQAN
jgi:hypothetical protein